MEHKQKKKEEKSVNTVRQVISKGKRKKFRNQEQVVYISEAGKDTKGKMKFTSFTKFEKTKA